MFVEKLINNLEKILNDLQCIYCEKTFPQRNILKEHMRKKLHKRINPQNRNYDEFYVINYLEEDKDWIAIEREQDHYAITRGRYMMFNKKTQLSWNDSILLDQFFFRNKFG